MKRPDPEVLPKAKRRKFSAKDKLAHIDAVAALKAYDQGGIDALKPKTRGRKNLSQDELDRREQARKAARHLEGCGHLVIRGACGIA